MTASPHVVVIGAGTLGMCTALDLVEQGARVTVLEAQSIASGSSGRSVGVVGSQFTDPFEIMLRVHSLRRFRQWEGEGLAFNHIAICGWRARRGRWSCSRDRSRSRPRRA